jgi:hypothetical protein
MAEVLFQLRSGVHVVLAIEARVRWSNPVRFAEWVFMR